LLVLGMILRGGKARVGAVQALLAFPLANEITDALKRNLPVERPFQALEWVLVRGGLESESMGTASAHSANMAAVAFAFTAALGWRWGLPWILAALLTGLSRIYVGVHFPSQVILGWACGVFAGMVIVYTYRAWQRRRDLREAQPA
ncbi:MAG TPA: phosphatase PAP2 family protein, partial [Fimbriimonadaceae bacterium]|nr:phosphatase PAP2 family protein [Fimbriimonadaceae bacterium]